MAQVTIAWSAVAHVICDSGIGWTIIIGSDTRYSRPGEDIVADESLPMGVLGTSGHERDN
jgi:hypothetical protein